MHNVKIPKLVVKDIEYPDDDRVYININDLFDVRIVKTDEGVVVDVFAWESTNDALVSTYAFDQEAIEQRVLEGIIPDPEEEEDEGV